jgi:general secretion pathway protein H
LGITARTASAGFTLLELVVVLFVLGLAYAVAGPLLGGDVSSIDLKAAARQVAAGLRRARDVAATSQNEAVLAIDVERRSFIVTGDSREYALPKKVDVALFTADAEVAGNQVGRIRFYPDGSSTGGRITFSAAGAKQIVDVDWLTGRVHID